MLSITVSLNSILKPILESMLFKQATYILDMPLRRLTKMSKIELETEQKELKSTIAELTKLLKSEDAIKAQVSAELTAVGKSYAAPRRTRIGAA